MARLIDPEFRASEIARAREYALNKNYGITTSDFEAMNESQSGLCAICGNKNGKRRLCVDHCHTTGRVRALLCMKCNVAIGHLGDCPDNIRKALEYIKEHKIGIDGDTESC